MNSKIIHLHSKSHGVLIKHKEKFRRMVSSYNSWPQKNGKITWKKAMYPSQFLALLTDNVGEYSPSQFLAWLTGKVDEKKLTSWKLKTQQTFLCNFSWLFLSLREDKIVFWRKIAYQGFQERCPLNPNTLFQICTCTKTFPCFQSHFMS